MSAPMSLSMVDWTGQDCAELCQHVQQYGAQDWAAIASTLNCSVALCTLKWNVMYLQCFPMWDMGEYSAWELGVLLVGYNTLSGMYGTLRQMNEVLAGWLPGRTPEAVKNAIKRRIRDQRASPLKERKYPGTLGAMLEAWPGPRSDCQVHMQTPDKAVATIILERLQLQQASATNSRRSGRSKSTTPARPSRSRKRSTPTLSELRMTSTNLTSSSPVAAAAEQRPSKRRSLFQAVEITKTGSLDSSLTQEKLAAPDAADWSHASNLAASHGLVNTDMYRSALALLQSSNYSATTFAAKACSDLAHKGALHLDGMGVQAWTVPGQASLSVPNGLQLCPGTALHPRYPPQDLQQRCLMYNSETDAACMVIKQEPSPVDPLAPAVNSNQSQSGHDERHMPQEITSRILHGTTGNAVVPAGYIPAGWCLQTGVEAVCMPGQQELQQDTASHHMLGVAASSQVDIWDAFMRSELQIPTANRANWPTGVQEHLQQGITKSGPTEPEQCMGGIVAAAAAALEPCSARLLCADKPTVEEVAPIRVAYQNCAPCQADIYQLSKTAASDVMLGDAAISQENIWEVSTHSGLEMPQEDQTNQPTSAHEHLQQRTSCAAEPNQCASGIVAANIPGAVGLEPCNTRLIHASQPSFNGVATIGVKHRGTAVESTTPCQAGMQELSKTAASEATSATFTMLSCPVGSAADGVSFSLHGTAPEGAAAFHGLMTAVGTGCPASGMSAILTCRFWDRRLSAGTNSMS